MYSTEEEKHILFESLKTDTSILCVLILTFLQQSHPMQDMPDVPTPLHSASSDTPCGMRGMFTQQNKS